MTNHRPARKAADTEVRDTDDGDALADMGLCPGQEVRWQSRRSGRWRTGRVRRLEADGSVALTDEKGASRSLPMERLEVRAEGPRGGSAWVAVSEQAGTPRQLPLL